jgi:hypothetical protein
MCCYVRCLNAAMPTPGDSREAKLLSPRGTSIGVQIYTASENRAFTTVRNYLAVCLSYCFEVVTILHECVFVAAEVKRLGVVSQVVLRKQTQFYTSKDLGNVGHELSTDEKEVGDRMLFYKNSF